MIKHNGYYITSTPDVEENAGGRFYQIYSDESCDNEVDNFCLSREQLADEDKLVRQYVDKLADGMAHEKIAEQLYDELQHNKILNYEEYSRRLYELLDKAHPNDERVGDYVGDVENIIHNKWSFGFCDMCGEVIFYDEGGWYDLCGDLYDYERERIEERLPADTEIQDVCATCFNKLVAEEWESQ